MDNIVNLEFAKRSWFYSASVFISLLLLFGCSSGKKLLESGDYYQSVLQSVERLRKNPDHRKSSETLNSAYPLALKYHETGQITCWHQTAVVNGKECLMLTPKSTTCTMKLTGLQVP